MTHPEREVQGVCRPCRFSELSPGASGAMATECQGLAGIQIQVHSLSRHSRSAVAGPAVDRNPASRRPPALDLIRPSGLLSKTPRPAFMPRKAPGPGRTHSRHLLLRSRPAPPAEANLELLLHPNRGLAWCPAPWPVTAICWTAAVSERKSGAPKPSPLPAPPSRPCPRTEVDGPHPRD